MSTLQQAIKASPVYAALAYAANGEDLHILCVYLPGETREDDQYFFHSMPVIDSTMPFSAVQQASENLRTRIYDAVPSMADVDDYKTMRDACRVAGIAGWQAALSSDILRYVPPRGYIAYHARFHGGQQHMEDHRH